VDDSTCNVSPEMYDEFSKPYDERIFEEFGGSGWMHYCGLRAHVARKILNLEGLSGADLAGMVSSSNGYGSQLEGIWGMASSRKIGLEMPEPVNCQQPRSILEFIRENRIQTGIVPTFSADSLQAVASFREHWEKANEAVFRD
jgi:hypothetical protein